MCLGVGSHWGKPATKRNKRSIREGQQDCGVPWGEPGVPLRLEIGCLDWLGTSRSIRQPALTWPRRGAGLRPQVRQGFRCPSLQQYVNSDRKKEVSSVT